MNQTWQYKECHQQWKTIVSYKEGLRIEHWKQMMQQAGCSPAIHKSIAPIYFPLLEKARHVQTLNKI